jgi:hypothetical protein
VLVVLSDLPNDRQLESEAAITMFKVLLTVTAVPQAARLAVGILVRSDGLEYVRFQLRLNIATIFSAFSNVAAPLLVVLLSDERCLKYRLYPRPAVTTETEFQYCELFIFNNNGEEVCLEYAEYNVESTYVPSFEYDGERCVSAVLSIYTPVFLASVLLAAVLPAAAEVLVVPRIAPWCHRRSSSSIGARVVLAALRSFTWNVPAVLEAEARAAAAAAAAGESDSPSLSQDAPPLPPADADYLAQRIVERGFGQLMATLLVALTFGVAAPPVGGACAVASLVQLLHHRHVLGQVVDLGLIHGRQGRVPNLAGRTAVPVGCAVTAAASVTSVWACAVLGGFLDLAAVGGAAGVVLASALFLLVAADRRFNKARKRYASSSSGSFSRLLRRKQQQQQQQEEKTSDKHKGRADQEAAQKGEGGGEEEEEEGGGGGGDGALRWSEINQAFRISKRDAAENRSSSFELKALDKTNI